MLIGIVIQDLIGVTVDDLSIKVTRERWLWPAWVPVMAVGDKQRSITIP
jgi:hypothetical protein